MKLTSVTRTRSGIVSVSGVGGAGAIKIDGLYKNSEDGLFYDKDDNNVQLKEGQIIYNDNGIYVVDDNDIHLLSTPLLIETTHDELVKVRDDGKLLPGCKYRITDYQCTTTQENTRSAGNQFDIVLLALSEDKLAEEGWIMEHPTDVYDITFSDGVTNKCYLYQIGDDLYNVVSTQSLLGISNVGGDVVDSGEELEIDEINKTAITKIYESTKLIEENLTYNYFQNSNLSAWKVWYCLDNDKSRFAWAYDSVDNVIPASITSTAYTDNIFYRNPLKDKTITFPATASIYGWTDNNDVTIYTLSTTPNVGDNVLNASGIAQAGNSIASYTPPTQGTGLPNGRGVIYRLIDEWNNDCPYDFKNIQFLKSIDVSNTDFTDNNGTEMYLYTFTLYDATNDEYKDASIFAIDYSNDEQGINPCYNNYIESLCIYDAGGVPGMKYINLYCKILPYNVFLNKVDNFDKCWFIHSNKLYRVINCNFKDIFENYIFMNCSRYTYRGSDFSANQHEKIILGTTYLVQTQDFS